jgi:hypothetical protein
MKKDKYLNFINDFEIFNIYDGLIKSVEPVKFIDIFTRFLRSKNIKHNLNYLDNGNIFIELYDLNLKNLEFYFSLIGNLGYFISEYEHNNIIKKYNKDDIMFLFYKNFKIDITIYVEPYYDIEIKNIPDILFHITPNIFVDKILKYGLFPKSKNKISFHPDRIFLCNDNIKTKILCNKFKKLSNYGCDWKILKINSKDIKDLKLYEDPNYRSDGGLYCLNNIENKYIEICE